MSNKPVYWRMRNGKLISVDEMDINHLRNVLKMIIRNNQKVQATCPHNISDAENLAEIEAEHNVKNYSRTCPNCNEEWLSATCCCYASEVDIY